jgi:putative membrane protein
MSRVDNLCLMLYAVLGTLLASVLAVVPALHVYSLAGLLMVLLSRAENVVSPQGIAMLMLGMVVGYAIVNTIPSVFLAVPDESAVWIVSPGQRYLMKRRGYEAAVLAGLGSMGGALALILLAPFVRVALVPIQRVI